MKRLILIHFKPDEAAERLARLRRAGYEAAYIEVKDFRSLAPVRKNPPDAFVIDQCVRPSFGRDVAAALSNYATTRSIPQIFIKDTTAWDGVANAIESARPSAAASRPPLAGYSGTPLPKKMGIKEGAKVITIGVPDTFEETLGVLPDGAEFVRAGRADLIIVFATTQTDLEARFRKAMRHVDERTRISIAWPKKTSGVSSNLNGSFIREFGLGMGWVEFKIFAINKTWSGLLFAPHKDAGARTLRQAAH